MPDGTPEGQGCGPGANVESSWQNKGNLFPIVSFNLLLFVVFYSGYILGLSEGKSQLFLD